MEKVDTSINPFYTNARYAARTKSSNSPRLYKEVTNNSARSLGSLDNRTLFVTQKAKFNGQYFYKVHSGIDNKSEGWMKSSSLRLFNLSSSTAHNKTYDIRTEKHQLLSDPFGTSDQHLKRLDRYGDAPFHTKRKVNLGAHTYYYGKIGKDYGWLEEAKLVDTSKIPFYTNARYAARVSSTNNSGLYKKVTDEKTESLGSLDNRTLFVTQKAKFKGQSYYKVHEGINDGAQGWMKSSFLRLFNLSKPSTHNRTYDIRTEKHQLLSDPFGTSKQHIKRLDKYGDVSFHAIQKVNLGAHTYYYGKIGIDYGWLEESKLVDTSKTPFYIRAKFAARISKNNQSGIYSKISSAQSKSVNKLDNYTLFISQKGKYKGQTYYKIHCTSVKNTDTLNRDNPSNV
ncbi:SH3-like domain-containing protein [Salinicoccus sp. YB14-2]|uniref:SH3-like domain-containing protein n=1 Tax=Salinicoccus sp. YB14-2 TaxID=1572701 RepID=UPI00068E19AC|nr:SH3-like domain-containing protein [Salinicoccus sp. YB14-2]